MKNKPYKQQQGDFEIRILKNGRVVMITPDDALMEVAQRIAPENPVVLYQMETKDNARKSAE